MPQRHTTTGYSVIRKRVERCGAKLGIVFFRNVFSQTCEEYILTLFHQDRMTAGHSNRFIKFVHREG